MPAELSFLAVAAHLRRLDGWRRWLVAFLAGAASALAMAPFFAWPVLWVTLPVLVWLLDGAIAGDAIRPRRTIPRAAAAVGWWYGFGYFLAGLFWIGEAFLVEGSIVLILMMPFAVALMPAGLALFYAAATAVAARVWDTGPLRVLALALALALAEWLRGHVLTGFPWNVLGYALTHPLSLMQIAAAIGIYALTLIAVLLFALPPVLFAEANDHRRRLLAVVVAVLPLATAGFIGEARLIGASTTTVPGVNLRIVQPSVPQRQKWQPQHQERIFLDHLALSARNGDGARDDLAGITHVIWPEAAMPFFPLERPEVRAVLGHLLPQGTLLIAGALRTEDAATAGAIRPKRFFNSLLVFGEAGSLVASYDKIRLVPFGEYLPMQGVLGAVGLRALANLRGSFDAGTSPRPLLHVPRLPPFAPLICYEAIFPRGILEGPERPGLLINLTNDGWFGNTTGPRQHLHQSRVRAVEEGLPLVRAANNGISAVIDGYGRIKGSLGLDERGVIDAPLPTALPPPLYARLGDTFFFVLWLLGAALVGFVLSRSAAKPPNAAPDIAQTGRGG